MKTIVADSNVVASWFLPDEKNGPYEALLKKLDKIRILVPSIFIYELMNVLLFANKSGRITLEQLDEAVYLSSHLPLNVEPISSRISENKNILSMAKLYDLTTYDASYLALSILHGKIPLATYDTALRAAAKKEGVKTDI